MFNPANAGGAANILRTSGAPFRLFQRWQRLPFVKSAVLLIAAAVLALSQQTEIQDGLLIRVTSDPSAIVWRSPLRYPKQAMAEFLQGTVVVRAAVDSAGRVRGVTLVSGPDAFRQTVIAAVKQWLFVAGPAEQQVSIEFRIPAQDLSAVEKAKAAIGGFQSTVPKPPRRPLAGRTVTDIQFLGIGVDAQEAVYERMGIKVGDTLSNEGMDRAEEGLRKLDPKIQFKVLSLGDTEALLILFRETAKK
jgi:TonB family protein